MTTPPLPLRHVLFALVATLAACTDSTDPSTPATSNPKPTLKILPTLGGPPPKAAGTAGTVRFQVLGTDDKPRAGVSVDLQVDKGGGKVEPAQVVSGPTGLLEATWTLGPAPVPQRVRATAKDAVGAALDTDATLAVPLVTQAFGDVDAWMTAHGKTGSTEDLAFTPDGAKLVLGIPGGLLQLDPAGMASEVTLTGDPLEGPLGLAYDAAGTLWVADNKGKALRTVQGGKVATALKDVAGEPLKMPNDLAIDAKGQVWLTDSCRGVVVRYVPSSGQATVIAPFDVATEGGPNGIAVADEGKTLWISTENVFLLCPGSGGTLDGLVAGLWKLDVQTGDRTQVLKDFGHFGDGVALDGDGNVYALFDTFSLEGGIALKESVVYVLPAGTTDARKFLRLDDRLYANLVFAPKGSPFGAGRPYLAILSAAPFTPESTRGVHRL